MTSSSGNKDSNTTTATNNNQMATMITSQQQQQCRRCSLGAIGVATAASAGAAMTLSGMASPFGNSLSYYPPTSITSSSSIMNKVCCSQNKYWLDSYPHSRGEASTLELEAYAAVQQLSLAVHSISVSEMLPRTPELIFVNVTTLEGQPYCLELTTKGWRITSLRSDCMQGDFTRMELFTRYFDNIYDLMELISPGYKHLFNEKLAQKLQQLEEEGIEGGGRCLPASSGSGGSSPITFVEGEVTSTPNNSPMQTSLLESGRFVAALQQ